MTRRETFDNLNVWLQESEQYTQGVGKEVVKLLVGNKVDMQRTVKRAEAESWAKAKGMIFMEASAKTTEGITQVFNEIVQKILENPALLFNTAPAKRSANLGATSSSSSGKQGGCC